MPATQTAPDAHAILSLVLGSIGDDAVNNGHAKLVGEIAVLLAPDAAEDQIAGIGVDLAMMDVGATAYQRLALLTKKPSATGLHYSALKLAGETGEVCEKLGKIIRDKAGVIGPEEREALIKELGDVSWYVASLCDELGTTLGRVLLENLVKVHGRKARGTLHGSGDNR